VTWGSAAYPTLLASIPDPPLVLFVDDLPLLDATSATLLVFMLPVDAAGTELGLRCTDATVSGAGGGGPLDEALRSAQGAPDGAGQEGDVCDGAKNGHRYLLDGMRGPFRKIPQKNAGKRGRRRRNR
jgi:hypothetical protein